MLGGGGWGGHGHSRGPWGFVRLTGGARFIFVWVFRVVTFVRKPTRYSIVTGFQKDDRGTHVLRMRFFKGQCSRRSWVRTILWGVTRSPGIGWPNAAAIDPLTSGLCDVLVFALVSCPEGQKIELVVSAKGRGTWA